MASWEVGLATLARIPGPSPPSLHEAASTVNKPSCGDLSAAGMADLMGMAALWALLGLQNRWLDEVGGNFSPRLA